VRIRAGRHWLGAQKYRCKVCGCQYTGGGGPKRTPPEVKQQALTMLAAGIPAAKVAAAFEVTRMTLNRWRQAARLET
jgi:transposase-like protein